RDFITVQCTLEGPLEYLALRAVVVDHPKATIAAVIGGVERLMLLSNVGDLAAYNEERTLLDLVKGSGFEPFCLTNAVLKFAANLLEQWPEGLKVLAPRPGRNLLGCLSLGKGGNITQASDVDLLVRYSRTKLGQQRFVIQLIRNNRRIRARRS